MAQSMWHEHLHNFRETYLCFHGDECSNKFCRMYHIQKQDFFQKAVTDFTEKRSAVSIHITKKRRYQ
jgi:hypothetical protein